MLRQAAVALCCGMLVAGCAGMRPDAGALVLTGSDDAAAAAVLRDRLHAAGLPVEPAESPASLFVYRRGRATLLSPVLQAEGLDRIIAARSYAPAAGRGAAELETLALSLNRALNVAGFKVSGDALLMEANLTFVDRLEVAELLAFLDWLDSIELAIRRVDAESRALLLTTS